MVDRLFGSSTRGRDEVHTLRRERLSSRAPHADHRAHEVSAERWFGVPEVCHVLARDDERMPRRRGTQREERNPRLALRNNLNALIVAARDRAERAVADDFSHTLVGARSHRRPARLVLLSDLDRLLDPRLEVAL